MVRLSFLKNLRVWDVIFGVRAKKLAGIHDGDNTFAGSLTFSAPATITFPSAVPAFLPVGKKFRITSGGGANNAALLTVSAVQGNVLTVAETVANFSGATTLDARLATVIDDPTVARLNNQGSTIFNVNKNAGSFPEGTGIVLHQAEHYHDGGAFNSPLTTKGDIWGYSTEDTRIPVGDDGDVLVSDSGSPIGVSWQSPTQGASPGFTWGRSGIVPAGTWLQNEGVPSNVAGRMISLSGVQISKIMVANAAPATFTLGVYMHDGVTYTLLGTLAIVADRVGQSTVAWPITVGKELAVKVESGTCNNVIVALVLEGFIT